MKSENEHYTAKLSGVETIEFYLENLKSNPAFSFTVTKQEDKISVQIIGPRKKLEDENLNDIHAQLSNRAQKIGIDFPGLVESTGRDIFNAQKAEEIVLAGKMQLEAVSNTKADSVSVTLYVVLDGDPKVDECIDQYALLRITWLANTLGMKFERFEKKSIQLQ
jgi:hypothetical protein